MNPYSPHSRQYKSLLAASLSLLSLVGLLIPSFARADITVTVDKGQDSSQKGASTPSASSSSASSSSASGSSSSGRGGKGGSSSGSGGKTVTGDSSSTFFTITLRNTLNTPVKGVEVEYHIYNKTTVIATGPATNTVDDITDKVTVDLDGGGSKQVETKDVPHVVTNTVSSGGGGGGGGHHGGGGKGGGASASSTSSSVQDVMGWVIYLNFKGKRVHTFTSSDTIVDQVAKYMNPQGGNGGN
jgi:hypothetical protein